MKNSDLNGRQASQLDAKFPRIESAIILRSDDPISRNLNKDGRYTSLMALPREPEKSPLGKYSIDEVLENDYVQQSQYMLKGSQYYSPSPLASELVAQTQREQQSNQDYEA